MSQTILYINTPTYTGGAEISLLTLMHHLNPSRYRPVLVTSGEGQLAKAAREHGIATFTQKFPMFGKRYPWRYPASIIQLAGVARRHRVALVHTNCPNVAQHAGLVSRWLRLPYVAHIRDFRDAWFLPEGIQFLQKANCVLANSKAVAGHFAAHGVPDSLIKIVYNPIDISRYANTTPSTQRSRIRHSFGIQDNVLLIGIVGQIQEIKGHADLVKAAPAILSSFPEAHFLIVGAAFDEGARQYELRLRTLIHDLNLDDHFHLIGFQNDVGAIMRALDVLVVPSWLESFGRVVVEGMAAGCPVVGTHVGGIPEIIEDGTNGLLVQPRDSTAIASAVITLGGNVQLRQAIVKEGRITADRFSIKAHVSQIETLYDSLLSR